jgi:hypothetical protein
MTFKAKKNILNITGALSLFSWFLFIYLHFYYFDYLAPKIPNIETGQIYQVNNHGWIFYLTLKEEIITFIPCGVAVIGSIALALLERRWKIYKQIYGK